jgi:uncharacterized membrane protein
MRKAALVLALLAACLPPACTPPDAALDGDLEIAGMDPAFWGVKVERSADRIVISINFEPDFTGSAPVKTANEDGSYLLTSSTPKGDFVMRLEKTACLSGLDNDMAFDWSVSLDWAGETWKGCAKPVSPAPPAAPRAPAG